MSGGAIQTGPAVVAGYDYRLRIELDAPLLPAGATLVGHVRARPSAADLLATLTTENGGLTILTDYELEILIPGAATAALPAGRLALDIARTDLTPPRHLGFGLEIPVTIPVTRGLT